MSVMENNPPSLQQKGIKKDSFVLPLKTRLLYPFKAICVAKWHETEILKIATFRI